MKILNPLHKPFEFTLFFDADLKVDAVWLPTFVNVVFYDETAEVCPSAYAHLAVQDPFSNATTFRKPAGSSIATLA